VSLTRRSTTRAVAKQQGERIEAGKDGVLCAAARWLNGRDADDNGR
jgi:hypothetical protein